MSGWKSALIFSLLSIAVTVLVLKRLLDHKRVNPRGLHHPPGPTPLPLIGNVRDISTLQPWLTYARLAKTYGHLIYFRILGLDLVIVNSEEIANELLDKRSKLYSDRPTLPMAEMTGWDFNAGLMPYGNRWRANRRMLHHVLSLDATLNYQPIQLAKVHEYLRSLLKSPADFAVNIRALSATIIMKTVYGYEAYFEADRYVDIAVKAVNMFNECSIPGAFAVNSLPILRYLPEWFPGTRFHQYARECRKLTSKMRDAPLEFAKNNMAAGTEVPCMVSTLLEKYAADGTHEQEDMVKDVAATTFAAGVDTTVSSSSTAILAMVLYPEAQKKAQAEIDRVIGTSRLPHFGDRPSLPYVEAFYREVMRWHPVAPIGFAHATIDNDIYDGYFISKGTVVAPNIWAMTRNEEKYQDPEKFKPERFFTADGKLNDDDISVVFGFGRRICPGRHLAGATVWATIASILAVFDISKAQDEAGNEIEVEECYTGSFTVQPSPFSCSIVPRSLEVEGLVLETASDDV